jgi:hypothetical protein
MRSIAAVILLCFVTATCNGAGTQNKKEGEGRSRREERGEEMR